MTSGDPTIPAETIHVVLTEMLRHELARILREQDQGSDLGNDEIDTRIEFLNQNAGP